VDHSGHGGENLGSITCGEFLDWLRIYKLLKKGLWSMQVHACMHTYIIHISHFVTY